MDRQDPVGGGEAQSANPIPRIIVGIDNPGVHRRHHPGRPGHLALGQRSADQHLRNIAPSANLEARRPQPQVGFEMNRARHLQPVRAERHRHAGLPQHRRPRRPACCRRAPATTTTGTFPQPGHRRPDRRRVRQFQRDRRHQRRGRARSRRSIYSVFLQDDWEVNDQLDVVGGVRVDWYGGGRPTANPEFFQRATASPTRPASTISIR